MPNDHQPAARTLTKMAAAGNQCALVEVIEDMQDFLPFAQVHDLPVGEIPATDLLREQPGVVEQLVIGRAQVNAVVGGIESRQSPDPVDEVVPGLRVVDSPPRPAKAGPEATFHAAAIRVDQPGDLEFGPAGRGAATRARLTHLRDRDAILL